MAEARTDETLASVDCFCERLRRCAGTTPVEGHVMLLEFVRFAMLKKCLQIDNASCNLQWCKLCFYNSIYARSARLSPLSTHHNVKYGPLFAMHYIISTFKACFFDDADISATIGFTTTTSTFTKKRLECPLLA